MMDTKNLHFMKMDDASTATSDVSLDVMCEKYPQLRLGISSYNLLKNEVFGFLLM